jgi:hypothetical protein
VGECNSHSQKWETWNPLGLPKTQKTIWRVKSPRIGVFFISMERYWNLDAQMALHGPFGHLQPKLWAKEESGIKLSVWLPTTKSRESTSSRHPLKECDTTWKALNESYNFGSNLVPIRIWGEELWASKISGLQPGTVSGLQLGSPGKKSHSDVASAVRRREYYMGEGGGFPRVRAVVSLVCQSGLSQHPRVFPNAN